MMRLARAGAVVVALALLLSCAPSSPTATPPSIDGTSWRAISVGGEIPIVGHDVTLEISGGRVSGTTGCNAWGGELLERDGAVILKPGAMTAAACADPAPARMEERVVAVLLAEPTLELRPDGLVMRAPRGEIVYVPVAP